MNEMTSCSEIKSVNKVKKKKKKKKKNEAKLVFRKKHGLTASKWGWSVCGLVRLSNE